MLRDIRLQGLANLRTPARWPCATGLLPFTPMAIRPEDVMVVSTKPMSAMEAAYLPEVIKGFGITFRHLFTSWGQSRFSPVKTTRTMQYPEERREDLPVEQGGIHAANFRGVHRLNRDEQGRVKCVACMMCPTICPAKCIHIVAGESPWEDREKYPVKFEIDELRCIYCGMCEEACPVDAIELTPLYDVVGMTRQEMIFDKEKLLKVYDETIAKKPM
jgi:NADH-quinone oxidoreductase subunit I